LVVDDRDHAARPGAERVLRGGVGVAAGAEQADVPGGVVRRAPDLVQRAVVRAVQGPGRAVRGHAGRAARGVDVARLRRGRLRGTDAYEDAHDEGADGGDR